MSKQVCSICGGELALTVESIYDTRFGIEGELDVFECARCGVESTLPAPGVDELKALYEKHYNFEQDANSGSRYKSIRQLLYSSFVYKIWMALDGDISFHSRKGSGRLLDVGCNEGRGLEIMRANGYTCYGLELNSVAAEVARTKGFQIESEMIENHQPGEPYDVVVLSNVIEHSTDPGGMLDDIHRVLNPGGEVWLSVPNSRSIFRSIFRKRWINWHPPFHLFHFSPHTLSRMLVDHGFRISHARTRTPAIWITQSVISSVFSKQGTITGQLRNPVLVGLILLVARFVLFPLLFVVNRFGRGDSLIVVASKVER